MVFRNRAALLLFLAAIGVGGATRADTVSLMASKDNTIFQDSNTLSNGKGPFVFVGLINDNFVRRGLIAFDVSGIPSTATVTSATLSLYLTKMGPISPGNTHINKVLRNWGEGNSNSGSPGGHGAPAQTNDATWINTFFNTAFWTTPGGDFSPVHSATAFVNTEAVTYTWSGTGVVADVQSWVTNSATNFGWILIGNETDLGSAAKYNTRENTTHKPQLDVTYQLTPPTPTPTATATATPSPTPSPTPTPTQTPTASPTPTPVVTATPTPTSTPSGTLTPTPTPGLTPSPTPTPTATATPGSTPSPSPTPSPTSTPIVTPTETPSPSPVPTVTPTASPTPTSSPTPTPTPASSPTPSGTPTPVPSPAQALNISTRLRVENGINVLIGGFIVTGDGSKRVIARGIGPSLVGAGITGVLANPILELRDHDGSLISANDDWQDDPDQAALISVAGLAPQNPNESALITTLTHNAFNDYTVILSGKNQTTGVGLVEIYDADHSAEAELANISTRGLVQSGNNVMIGGFILDGTGHTRVAVRGLGPSLALAGLGLVLADPTLELHNGNGTLLVSNNDWQDDPLSASQLTFYGLAPTDPMESGIYTTLPPGSFTAILAGNNGGSGIGLVEIYNLK